MAPDSGASTSDLSHANIGLSFQPQGLLIDTSSDNNWLYPTASSPLEQEPTGEMNTEQDFVLFSTEKPHTEGCRTPTPSNTAEGDTTELNKGGVSSLPTSSPSKPTAFWREQFKSRKRTKTGCLTCRKRRLKCDEERPQCKNCFKSKRACEGYNHGIIFKSGNLDMRCPYDQDASPWISSWMVDTYTPSTSNLSPWMSTDCDSSGYNLSADTVSIVDSAYMSAAGSTSSTVHPTPEGLILKSYEPHFDLLQESLPSLGDFMGDFQQDTNPLKKRKLEEGAAEIDPLKSLPGSDNAKVRLLPPATESEMMVGFQSLETVSAETGRQTSKPAERARRQRINSTLQQIETLLPAKDLFEDVNAGHSDSGYETSIASGKVGHASHATSNFQPSQQEIEGIAERDLNSTHGCKGNVSVDIAASPDTNFSGDSEASGLSEESDTSMDLDWTGHILDSLRAPAVARLLARLFSGQRAGLRTCHGGGQQGGSGNRASSGGSPRSNGLSSKHSKLPQKRKADDYEQNDKDEEEDGARIRPPTKKEDQGPEKLLACPFCKLKPRKYRSCYKYTLRDISRVKQHLRRCHGIPKYCPSCYSTFGTEKARDDHIRSRNCQNAPPVDFECVSEEQRKLLEQRVSKSKSTVENWYTIFEILFPGTPRPSTPYVEGVLSEQLCEFQDFTSIEGPQIVNDLIQARIPPPLRPQEYEVSAFVHTLFQDGVTALLERWETSRAGGPSNERSLTSATNSEASPELARMPLPQPDQSNPAANFQYAPQQIDTQNAEGSRNRSRREPELHANNQGFNADQPTPVNLNPDPSSLPPPLTAPRMVPNLSNGSWQPQTPDSGYRSGSSGNAAAGSSRVPIPTSSPFMGYIDRALDELLGADDFDPTLLWPAPRE
ncbi:MAG: hypothetical protein Q9157_004782 [Trypethelium eluteriae]